MIGSDDSLMAEFTDPPLTTVRQPAANLATAACRNLIELISGHTVAHGDVIFQPELVVRGSTAKVLAPLA